MYSFTYKGCEYRSLKECCDALNISYQKVRRLCRHYVRARTNPQLAIKWSLGIEVRSWNEPKTEHYNQDLQKSRERQWKFKEKIFEQIKDLF